VGVAPWKLTGLAKQSISSGSIASAKLSTGSIASFAPGVATSAVSCAGSCSTAVLGLTGVGITGAGITGPLAIAGEFNSKINSDEPNNPDKFDEKTNDIMIQLEESMIYVSLLLNSVGNHVKSNPSTQMTSTRSSTTTTQKSK
jgi:hypothetical protein